MAKHRTKLSERKTRLVDSALYRVEIMALEFEKARMQKMLWMGVIEQAKMERTSLIVFAPKSVRSLRFIVGYMKLNAVTE